MRASAASIDITPPIGLPIGGNVRADNISRGKHDSLFCNIILFEGNDEKVCFLSFDFLGLGYETCKKIKANIMEKSGISSGKIIISATHTHSGPDVVDFFKDNLSGEILKYLDDVSNKVADAVLLVKGKLEQIDIRISKVSVNDLSFNRRLLMKDGRVKMNWEEIDTQNVERACGTIDSDLSVITIGDKSGNIKAIIVNFTLHPAVLVGLDWLWSRDYINYLDTYIKQRLGNDVLVFFFNGAEGNINHLNYKNRNRARGFDEAKRIGENLGKYVISSLENAQEQENDMLKCISASISLPLRAISEEELEKTYSLINEKGDSIPSLLDGVPDEVYARELIKLSRIKNRFVETEIQVVWLGECLIVTLPGEAFVEFGLRIKEASGHKNTLIFGLTNDCIGYIPTQEAFREGGYEIKTATSSKLDPIAGDILVIEILKLIK